MLSLGGVGKILSLGSFGFFPRSLRSIYSYSGSSYYRYGIYDLIKAPPLAIFCELYKNLFDLWTECLLDKILSSLI